MKIVLLGSGNIATHLGKALYRRGHTIVQVYSRQLANAQTLAKLLDTQAIHQLAEVNPHADIYLLAVADQAIANIAEQLPIAIKGIVVHCSGATDIQILRRFARYGVIYPPQSINKHLNSSLETIPFGVEGNSAETTGRLLDLIKTVSDISFLCNTEQRLALHTAAVFANNFSNVLFGIAYGILHEQHLSFDLLKPIILETAQKVQNHRPDQVQTGPAIRGDKETIAKHLKFLSEKHNWLKIYQQLTEEIISKKHK